ncbi:MAG: acyltransferase, partial [Cytophagales bacterium]|nr:acyltransferase [Cytophaga sp.]
FMQPTLPGVFEDNYIHAVNGSLWTLKIEIMFYLSVPIIMYVTRFIKRDIVFILLYCASVFYLYFMLYMSKENGNALFETFAKQLPGQLMYFTCGALIYYHFDKFSKIPFWILIPASIVYFISLRYHLYILLPVCLSAILFPLAFAKIPLHLSSIAKIDISYGLYLFHYPVIQVFCDKSFFDGNKVFAFMSFTIVIFLISYGSWMLIEKRFIHRK